MQPLDREVHYGFADRSYLDRNPIQMDLLPEKLRELRWKLNLGASQPMTKCSQESRMREICKSGSMRGSGRPAARPLPLSTLLAP